jgi:hypothetical protein
MPNHARNRLTTIEEFGTIEVTTTGIDRAIMRALRLAAVKDNRLLLAVVCEAALEWLVEHDHELPAGYELVVEEAPA